MLVGKTASRDRKDNGDLHTNTELLDLVKKEVRQQYGNRPTFVINTSSILSNVNRYPNYYAAVWLTSTEPVSGEDGVGSELVIIEHGSTMEFARKSLLDVIENIEWDDLAATIPA